MPQSEFDYVYVCETVDCVAVCMFVLIRYYL